MEESRTSKPMEPNMEENVDVASFNELFISALPRLVELVEKAQAREQQRMANMQQVVEGQDASHIIAANIPSNTEMSPQVQASGVPRNLIHTRPLVATLPPAAIYTYSITPPTTVGGSQNHLQYDRNASSSNYGGMVPDDQVDAYVPQLVSQAHEPYVPQELHQLVEPYIPRYVSQIAGAVEPYVPEDVTHVSAYEPEGAYEDEPYVP